VTLLADLVASLRNGNNQSREANVLSEAVSAFCLDRGWSMKLSTILPLIVFGLALMGVVKANDRQMQQTLNAAIGVLAIRSGASQNRRSVSYALVRHQPVNTTRLQRQQTSN